MRIKWRYDIIINMYRLRFFKCFMNHDTYDSIFFTNNFHINGCFQHAECQLFRKLKLTNRIKATIKLYHIECNCLSACTSIVYSVQYSLYTSTWIKAWMQSSSRIKIFLKSIVYSVLQFICFYVRANDCFFHYSKSFYEIKFEW